MYVCVTQQLAQMFMENIKVGLQNVLAAQRADEEGEGEGEEGCREEEERDGEEGGGKGEEGRGSVLAGVVLCLHKKTNAQYGGQLNTLHCVCVCTRRLTHSMEVSLTLYTVYVYMYTYMYACMCRYTLYIVPKSHLRQLIFLRIPLGVLCCFALLFVCSCCFFLPSFSSLIKICTCIYVHCRRRRGEGRGGERQCSGWSSALSAQED